LLLWFTNKKFLSLPPYYATLQYSLGRCSFFCPAGAGWFWQDDIKRSVAVFKETITGFFYSFTKSDFV
jgi:hypothetical protein